MKRRGFVAMVVAGIVALVRPLQSAAPKRWGLMTLERHNALRRRGVDLIVTLNGQRVRWAYEADDIEGYIHKLRTNAEGHPYVDRDTRRVARETLRGTVRFERMS
jgi:hypothetical protein